MPHMFEGLCDGIILRRLGDVVKDGGEILRRRLGCRRLRVSAGMVYMRVLYVSPTALCCLRLVPCKQAKFDDPSAQLPIQ